MHNDSKNVSYFSSASGGFYQLDVPVYRVILVFQVQRLGEGEIFGLKYRTEKQEQNSFRGIPRYSRPVERVAGCPSVAVQLDGGVDPLSVGLFPFDVGNDISDGVF